MRYMRKERKKNLLLLTLICAVAAARFDRCQAQDITSSGRDLYGEVGMLDMPSARMAPDGQFAIQFAGITQAQRATLAFQALPWLEASFRYTRIPDYFGKTDYDRSFGLKIRLFQETDLTPDVSIGIRDLLGTGLYSAEYLAATKRIFNIDVTAGVGWGRMAQNGTFHNAFGLLFNSFDTRAPFAGQGGTVNFGQYFHGPDMGLFGGLVWHTPIDKLSVLVEYSSDRYANEKAFGGRGARAPVNFGLSYGPIEGLVLSAGWLYGDTIGASLTVALDPTTSQAPAKTGTPPMRAVVRTDKEQQTAVTRFVMGLTEHNPASARIVSNDVSSDLFNLAQHVEIDGPALLADVHANGALQAQCRLIANHVARSAFLISTIAVSDLDSPDTNVAICEVPKAHTIISVAYAPASNKNLQTAIAENNIKNPIQDPSTPDNSLDSSDQVFEQKIRADAAEQAIRVEALSIGQSGLTIYYANTRYEFESTAIGRLVRILMADAPSRIEEFHLIATVSDVPTQEIRVLRGPFERMTSNFGSIAEIPEAIAMRAPPVDNPILNLGEQATYPRFSWAIAPKIREGFFDPASPVRIQIYGALSGSVELLQGLSVQGSFEAAIYDTFTTATPSNSVLPHVRTDIAQYFTKGKTGFSSLDAEWVTRATPDIFLKAKAGYLEDMYVGIGGEALWRPEGRPWAIGADIYAVWKRNFDRLFGWQKYHVLTGHVSAYYRSPWYGLNFAIHAGRYLAGDYGATIEIGREFKTGVEVGAYATFTNVPFSKFGEGSFDKGIYIRIPFEWALPFSTQSEYDLTLSPLTRDGGQRLDNDDSLYEQTRRTSYDEISGHLDEIGNP